MPVQKTAFEFMCEIFTQAKENRTYHEKSYTKLSKAYDKVPFDEFFEAYEKCLKISLSYPQKNRQIENALEFAASFATKLNFQSLTSEDGICPFLERLLELLMEIHKADKADVRYRVCYFLNLLLTKMHEDACLPDEYFDKITKAMLIRIMDPSPKVRTQAVYALHRIQQPSDEQCDVIEAYIYHLEYDPSPEVRKAIIKCIGKNRKILEAILERIHDVDESVKKLAYLFMCKITMKSLTIKERQMVMKYGLQDQNETAKVVKDYLLPTWLDYCDNNITNLLYALDPVTDTNTCCLVLKALFQRMDINDIIKQLPINPDTKLIPIEKLNNDNVIFWRCFVQFLKENSNIDLLNDIIPELGPFNDYIRTYEMIIKNGNYEFNEIIERQAVLQQLFEMTKLYDLSDEFGRNSLKKLIEDTLMSDIAGGELIEFIVHYYKTVVPNVTARVNILTHIINDIRMPLNHLNDLQAGGEEEKNDAKTMIKCLTIMYAMLESLTVYKLTPIIKSLFNNLALPCINHTDDNVRLNALKTVGICLAMDVELAKIHIPNFFMIFTSIPEQPVSWVIALNVIFELFLVHGLDCFELVNAAGVGDSRNNTAEVCSDASHADTPNNHVITMMMGLMNHEIPSIQVAATEGFCRLLLKGRIKSVQLVVRLILLLHNPAYESQSELRQSIVAFFEYFALFNEKENQKILENTFFLVLREIFDADINDALTLIDPCNVARFIFDITRYKIYKNDIQDEHYAVHNNLALKILREAVNPNTEYDVPTLIKCLQYVDVKITDEKIRDEMLKNTKTILGELSVGYKKLVSGFKLFIKKVEAGMQFEDGEEETATAAREDVFDDDNNEENVDDFDS